MKNITDPRHRKLHPMRGEPLPLTKNISPPPNFRLEVEKKLGGIMNSRNSDNKEATWLTECAESPQKGRDTYMQDGPRIAFTYLHSP